MALCLSLLAYDAKVLVAQGEVVAVLQSKVEDHRDRLIKLEGSGSESLRTHVKDDDTRVQDIKDRISKLESAYLLLSSMPGELKAISARLDGLQEGQRRIENHVIK